MFYFFLQQMTVAFQCEREPWKAKLLAKAFHSPIVFSDMMELPKGKGHDHISGVAQPVPQAPGLNYLQCVFKI